jgi:putative sterol carrier protein
VPEIFNQAWAQEWCRRINSSAAFREAAAEWRGTLAVVMRASRFGGDGARGVLLDLRGGSCSGARAVPYSDALTAQLVFSGTPSMWRRVLEGSADPVLALMLGQLRLERGRLAELTPYARAAKHLLLEAAALETTYPEG